MGKITRSNNGKSKSVPGALASGAAASIVTTIVTSCLTAFLIHTERISWENVGYWIMTILFLSSYLGANVSYKALKRQKILISGLSGILYWGLLLSITALFFGGHFSAVPETAAIIAAGSMGSGLITRSFGKEGSRKAKMHYC